MLVKVKPSTFEKLLGKKINIKLKDTSPSDVILLAYENHFILVEWISGDKSIIPFSQIEMIDL